MPWGNEQKGVEYKSSDMDTLSNPKYFGSITQEGDWIILEMMNNSDLRYIKGSANYSTNWTNRAALSYVLYSDL